MSSMNPFNIIGSSIPRAVGRFFGSSQPKEAVKDQRPSSLILSSSPPSKIPRPKSLNNTNGSQSRSPTMAHGVIQGMRSGGKGIDGEGDVDMDRLSGSEPEVHPEHLPEPKSEKRSKKKKKRTSKSKVESREVVPEGEDQLHSETADRVEPPPILPGHSSTAKKNISQLGLNSAQEQTMYDSPITQSAPSKRSKGKKRVSKPSVSEKELEGPLGIELAGRGEPPPILPGARSKNKQAQTPDMSGKERGLLHKAFHAGPDFDDTPTIKKSKKSKKKSLPLVDAELPDEEDVPMNDAPLTKKPKKNSLPAVESQSLEQEDISIDEQTTPSELTKIRAPKKPKVKVHALSEAAPESEALEPVSEDVEVVANSKKKKKAKAPNVPPVHESNTQEDDLATPRRPSAKALGKRKASPIAQTTQKKRKGSQGHKNKPGVSLFDLGFTSQRSPHEDDTHNLMRSSSHSRPSAAANRVQVSPEPQLPSTSKSSKKRKSKAKTPIVLGSARPSSATNQQFTPHTSAKTPSKTVDLVANSDDSLEIQPPPTSLKKKRRLVIDEDDEAGPSSVKSSKVLKSQSSRKNKDKPPRPGKIIAEEMQTITSAVELYQEMHDLTKYQMAEIVQMTESDLHDEHKGFWKEIRDAVPDLPNRKVFEFCRRKFHNFEARGSWTPEQDEELKKAYERCPQKWKQIGGLINRFPEDARDRWRNYLVCGNNLRKDKWDKEEEDNLRQAVAKCVEIAKKDQKKPSQTPAPKSYEELIDWGTVSLKMGMTRSRLQCISKWKQMKERGDSEDERLTQVTTTEWREAEATRISQTMEAPEVLQLLQTIRGSGAGKESSIPWLLIVEEMGVVGKNKRMAFKVCFRKLREKVPGGEDMRFREVLEFLIGEFEAVHPSFPEAYRDYDVIQDVKRRNRASKKDLEESDGDLSTQILQEAALNNGEGSSQLRTRDTRPVVEIPRRFHRPNSEASAQKKKSRNIEEEATDGEHHLPLGSQKPFRTPKSKDKAKPLSPPPDEEAAADLEEQQPKKKRRKSKSTAEASSPQPEEAHESFVGADSDEQEEQPVPSPKMSKKSKSQARAPSPHFDEERVVEVEEHRQSLKSKKKDRKAKSKVRVQSPQPEEEVPEPMEVASETEQQPIPSRKKSSKSKSKSKARVEPLSEERVLDSEDEEIEQQVHLSPLNRPRKSKSKAKISHVSEERVVDSDADEEQQASVPSPNKSLQSRSKARVPPAQLDEKDSDQPRPKEKKNRKLRDRMEAQEEEVDQEPVEGFGFAADMSEDLSDVFQAFKKVNTELQQKRKEKQKIASKVTNKEMPVEQHLESPGEEEEEVIDASQFSEAGDEPQTNGHVEEDLEMMQVDEDERVSQPSGYDDEPQVNGYASDSSSDGAVEHESVFNGFTTEVESDVPEEEEEVAQESIQPAVIADESQWYKDLLAEEERRAALSTSVEEDSLVKSEEDLEMAQVRSPASVYADQPLANGYHNPSEGKLISQEVTDAEENLKVTGMANGNTADDSSEIDDDSNNFGFRADFSDSDSSDAETRQHRQDLDDGPEEMDVDQEELHSTRANASKSPSPVQTKLVDGEHITESTSTSGSSAESDEELADEPEAYIECHPNNTENENPQPEAEDHEMVTGAMDNEGAPDSDIESEGLQAERHVVDYERMPEEFDDGPEQMADDELEQVDIDDMAEDENEEEFENGTTLVEGQPEEFVPGLISQVKAIREQPVEYQPETETTPEPFVAQRSLSPDLDTPIGPDDGSSRPVSPDLGTPVKPNEGHSRSVSPDLDTPIKHDGRKFRTRGKKINYDDTAALRAEEEEAMISSDEEAPKRGKGRRKVAVVDNNIPPPNGSNFPNGFGPINGFEAIRRQHGRPDTPPLRRRRDSESSSDYSIPPTATPQHIRDEKNYDRTP